MIALQPHRKDARQTKVMVDGYQIASVIESRHGFTLYTFEGQQIGQPKASEIRAYELAKQTWPEVA